ncbi:hypothetical protein V6N13_026190 [Hibiscus sabdariffa]
MLIAKQAAYAPFFSLTFAFSHSLRLYTFLPSTFCRVFKRVDLGVYRKLRSLVANLPFVENNYIVTDALFLFLVVSNFEALFSFRFRVSSQTKNFDHQIVIIS